MGAAALLDAAIVAPAVVLGLLGLWLGFVRSTVAWPMRWLIPLLGAYAAGRLAELGLLIAWETTEATQLLGPPVGWVALVVTFLATLVPLLMFMDNLIARVAAWTAGRRTGLGERVLGGLCGIAFGLVLVGITIEHTPIRRAAADEPAWASESVLLPYVRRASEAVEDAVAMAWPPTAGIRRRDR
jgi:uncharacterized membrane protein required for colicin V production